MTRVNGEDDSHLVRRQPLQETFKLSEQELASGFVRPVRLSYTHIRCGTHTKMNVRLAEVFARNPTYYAGAYCIDCDEHFPVGRHGEFVWQGTEDKVGT